MPAPADVDWEAARRLWEGTDLSQGEIADQFGVARTTVAGAARRFGWGPRPPRGAGRPAVAKKPHPGTGAVRPAHPHRANQPARLRRGQPPEVRRGPPRRPRPPRPGERPGGHLHGGAMTADPKRIVPATPLSRSIPVGPKG